MKKSIIRKICLIIIAVSTSALIEIFAFNFRAVFFSETDYSLDSYKYIDDGFEEKVEVEVDRYVKKIDIQYTTQDDVKFSFDYFYNENKSKNVADCFNNELTHSVNSINRHVDSITIKYPKKSQLQIQNIIIKNSFHFNILRFIFVFGVLLTALLIYWFIKDRDRGRKLHLYFLAVGALIGSLMIILQPATTFYSTDDETHFIRSMEFFGGKHNYSGSEAIMISLDSVGRDSITAIEEINEQQVYIDNKSSEVSPFQAETGRIPQFDRLVYLPSAIGYNITKLFGLPFSICFRIGKLFNLIAYLLVMAFAIKIAKVGKRLLLVIGLMPTNIFLASQYAYDAAVTAGIAVFLAQWLNIILDKNEKVDFGKVCIMLFSMFYACSAKIIYAPFLLLALLIPVDRFRDKKQTLTFKIGISLLCLLLLTIYILPIATALETYDDHRGGDTSVQRQIMNILGNPVGFISVFYNNAVVQLSNKLTSASTLGFFGYIGTVSQNLNTLFLIFLVLVGITDNQGNVLKTKYKISMLILNICIYALIWIALYLSFTPVGSESINGVQNRYFVPLIFPLLVCVQSQRIKNKINEKTYDICCLAIPTAILLVSIFELILTRYCL